MNNSTSFSLFLPVKTLENLSSSFVFGYYIIEKNNLIANCKYLVKIQQITDFKLFKQIAEIKKKESNEALQLQLLGIIYASKRRQKFHFVSDETRHFVLRVDITNDSFFIEKLCFDSLIEIVSSKIILYDSNYLFKCNLLLYRISSGHHQNFLKFLINSLKNDQKPILPHNYDSDVIDFSYSSKQNKRRFSFSRFLYFEVFFQFFTLASSFWGIKKIFGIINWSLVGEQFYQRVFHCKKIFSYWRQQNSVCLKSNNLILIILLDVILGWIVTFSFLKFSEPAVFLEDTIDYANSLVNELQKLIYWLMGVPAGLKLNIPLNNALGHFFLYHIYLWEAYITIVLPILNFILQTSTVIGVLGFTFFLSLLSDIVSLATIHIYCFYGYAARLYGYQVSSLSALWRLFRGKKYNPLRQRVDSYSYDKHQLYLGTLVFTVLLFLLPTVLVYYAVFTCLRILVLIFQGILLRIIRLFSVFPLYSLISRLTSASETAGDIYFTVFSSHATLVLSMQVNQSSLSTIMEHTLPEIYKKESTISWKTLLQSIIYGNIIYPL